MDGEDSKGTDIEFNDSGSEMFISVFNGEGGVLDRIHQFSLGKNYDVSTAISTSRFLRSTSCRSCKQ